MTDIKPAATGLLLGYVHVSKGNDQNNTLQIKALKVAGCRRLFEEAASGGRWDRPELHRTLDQLRDGDTVVVIVAQHRGTVRESSPEQGILL